MLCDPVSGLLHMCESRSFSSASGMVYHDCSWRHWLMDLQELFSHIFLVAGHRSAIMTRRFCGLQWYVFGMLGTSSAWTLTSVVLILGHCAIGYIILLICYTSYVELRLITVEHVLSLRRH